MFTHEVLSFLRCVWCVDVDGVASPDEPSIFIKAKYVPRTLSVTSRRLLVTPSFQKGNGNDGSCFYLYDVGGQLIKTVPWRSEGTALHSVETASGTFIVCVTGLSQIGVKDQVS